MDNIRSIFTAMAMGVASFSAAAVAQDGGAKLTVQFKGIEEQEGAVLGVVFDNEAAYNGTGAPVRQIMVKADRAEIATVLDGLAPGTYAIKIFHDVDGNMKLTTNPYGMPIEPFAFSNNATGNMGPAKWADAKFDVTTGSNLHVITVK